MDKFLYFFQVCILSFGFLNGLWIYVGVNPETEITNAFLQSLKSILPEYSGMLSLSFVLMEIVGNSLSIWLTYALGGIVGLISVLLAFLGGLFIGSFGVYAVLISIALGFLAVSIRTSKSG